MSSKESSWNGDDSNISNRSNRCVLRGVILPIFVNKPLTAVFQDVVQSWYISVTKYCAQEAVGCENIFMSVCHSDAERTELPPFDINVVTFPYFCGEDYSEARLIS